jgi:NADH:ubiquinone oxidoreductase subunit 6 (subunit J)
VIRVFAIIVAVAFYIWFVIDVAQNPKSGVRNLPKGVWLLIVVVLPILGGIIWMLAGRPKRARKRKASQAPDDDPKFLAKLAEDEWRRKMRERRGETNEQ